MPRPMEMGTTASPWRYDAVAEQAPRPDHLRQTAILGYASRSAVLTFHSFVRLRFDSGPLDQSRERRDRLKAEYRNREAAIFRPLADDANAARP